MDISPFRSALAEFGEDIERAADDLAYAISELFPDRHIELSPFEEDDDEEVDADGRRVIKGAIDERPDHEIDEALESFDWTMRRAMKRLKEALRQCAEATP
jgi:hypothetical protein